MTRPQLIFLPPKAQGPTDLDLALGIRSIWRCALFAAGVHVSCPPDDGCLDPGTWSSYLGDIGRTGEGRPAIGEVDGLVLSELAGGPDRWAIGAGLVRPEAASPEPGQVIASGEMPEAMWSVLEQLTRLIGVELPKDLHWTDLLRSHEAYEALEDLRALGRRELAIHSARTRPTQRVA